MSWENERIGAICNILAIYAKHDVISATDKALESAKLFLARIEKGVVIPPAEVKNKLEHATIVISQGWQSMKAIAAPMQATDTLEEVGIAFKKVLMLSLAHENQLVGGKVSKVARVILSAALELAPNQPPQPQGDE